MTEFKTGQRVHIEFDGVVERSNSLYSGSRGHTVEIRRDDGYLHSIRPEDVTSIAEPANWPPQVGDIWEANDTEYFIRRNTVEEDEVVIVPDYDGANAIYLDGTADFKALSPALIRRRGR